MRVASINTYDIQGGAARSAWRLHCGLRQLGLSSTLLAFHKVSSDPDVVTIQPDATPQHDQQIVRWHTFATHNIFDNRTSRSDVFFTLPVPAYDFARHPTVQQADVLQLHWVQGLLSPWGVRRLLELDKPVVWTLHDQRPFTGGCHFSFGCEGFSRDCSGCPELRDGSTELPRRMLEEAKAALGSAPITIVAPSRWLADCARRSTLFSHCRVEVIPYGIDTELFRPRNRVASRAALGLPAESLVLLFGSDSTEDKRKGYAEFEAALQLARADTGFNRALESGALQLLAFGKKHSPSAPNGLPIQHLGYIEDDHRLAVVYSATDLLVCPTLADNLPNVILEARACGTPCLGTRVGGVPDLVIPGETGELVGPGNTAELAAALVKVWNEPQALRTWANQTRLRTGDLLSLEAQARRYHDLYCQLQQAPRPTPVNPPPATVKLPLLPETWPPLSPPFGVNGFFQALE